jgi:hypothetical protein
MFYYKRWVQRIYCTEVPARSSGKGRLLLTLRSEEGMGDGECTVGSMQLRNGVEHLG